MEVFGRRLELLTHEYDTPQEASLDDAKLERWCEALRRHRPRVIDGYVSALCLLAHYILENGIRGIECRAVATGGEYLSPAARGLLTEAFRCPVFNRYGSTELGFIAHECGL